MKQMENCVMYNEKICKCNGLKKLYCKTEECKFFKSKDKYYLDKDKFVCKRKDVK